MARINITEEELRAKMKAETWLTEEEALEMGFATRIDEAEESNNPSQSAKKHLFEMLARAIAQNAEESPQNAEDDEDEEPDEGDDSNDGNGDSEPDDDEDEKNEDDPEPAQRWSGFFNAISRA